MRKLTKAQIETLKHIERWGYSTRIKFHVGEALRRRGLVTRYTTYIVRAIFANADGEHEQYNRPAENPIVSHEWDLTKAGRRALTTPESSEP